MIQVQEMLVPGRGARLRDPQNEEHVQEDLRNLKRGILDPGSFASGYQYHPNPVELTIRNIEGELKAIRRQKNLRVTMGRDQWQRMVMAGDITANATSYTGVTGTASSAPNGTSLTNSGAAFPTSGGINGSLQGHIVVCPVAGVFGVIMSNTATVLTVDQWTNMASATGAAGTTPANGAAYAIMAGGAPALWVALSTSTATPAAGDVLRTTDGLYGDGTTGGAATEQTASGLARVFVQPTLGSGTYVLTNTWTYTGSGAVTLAKVLMCNSKAAGGSLLFLETLLSATGTVTANGDQIQVAWTVTL